MSHKDEQTLFQIPYFRRHQDEQRTIIISQVKIACSMSQYPACSVHGPARKSLAPSAAWNSAVLIPVFQVLSTYVSYRSSSGILLSWYHRHSSLGVKKTHSYLSIFRYTHMCHRLVLVIWWFTVVCVLVPMYSLLSVLFPHATPGRPSCQLSPLALHFDWRNLNARILLLPVVPGMSFSLHPPFGFAPLVTRSSRVIDQSSCRNAG